MNWRVSLWLKWRCQYTYFVWNWSSPLCFRWHSGNKMQQQKDWTELFKKTIIKPSAALMLLQHLRFWLAEITISNWLVLRFGFSTESARRVEKMYESRHHRDCLGAFQRCDATTQFSLRAVVPLLYTYTYDVLASENNYLASWHS